MAKPYISSMLIPGLGCTKLN